MKKITEKQLIESTNSLREYIKLVEEHTWIQPDEPSFANQLGQSIGAGVRDTYNALGNFGSGLLGRKPGPDWKDPVDISQPTPPAPSPNQNVQPNITNGSHKEGDRSKSKSGKDIIFKNGKWVYV
jgi:hypothetical protein